MIFLVKLAYWLMRTYWWIVRPVTMGVRIILVQNDQVLLVQHTYHPGWQFPGGGVKRGETLAAAAGREAWEEVGAQLQEEPHLLGIYTNVSEGKTDHTTVFYATKFTLAQPTDRWEIRQRQQFPFDQLPAGLPASYRRRLQEYRENKGPYTGKW